MIELKTNQWPPDGWTFIEPLTGWRAPNPLVDNFEKTVALIAQHRMKNRQSRRSPDPSTARQDLIDYTRKRLKLKEQLLAMPKSNASQCPACGK